MAAPMEVIGSEDVFVATIAAGDAVRATHNSSVFGGPGVGRRRDTRTRTRDVLGGSQLMALDEVEPCLGPRVRRVGVPRVEDDVVAAERVLAADLRAHQPCPDDRHPHGRSIVIQIAGVTSLFLNRPCIAWL
jgi:hypothetical protein